MQKTYLFGRSSRIPVILATATLLGTAVYSLPGMVNMPAKAAGALTQTLNNGAPVAGFADLVEQVQPAVVSVRVKPEISKTSSRMDNGAPNFQKVPRGYGLEEFFGQFEDRFGSRNFKIPRRRGASQGSGFLISANGYVVTNNHVVAGGGAISIKFANGDEHKASLIGADPKTDLALLKIETSGQTFPFVKFAGKPARVGDRVIAVGNPFGLGGSVTTGIVSARGRDIGSGPYDDFLQIDAAINKGNFGGPAFNLKGEVIGVNTAIFSPSGGSVGIGFAIPADLANQIVADLKDDGNVTRGWLGVVIQPVTEAIAESLSMDGANGVIIADVQPDSPAKRAGLRVGDIILKVDGEIVNSPRELARKVASIKPDSTAKIGMIRNNRHIDKPVRIALLPAKNKTAFAAAARAKSNDEVSLASLGLWLTPTEGRGVMIVKVRADRAAGERGLRPGDHILEVSGIEVEEPGDVAGALERAGRKGRKSVLMLVRSGENQRFIALPLV